MKSIVLVALCSITLKLAAQSPPEPASVVLQSAYEVAAKENKKVFLIFHATWCGWCHKMDTAMNDISCKKLFTDNYVIRHLDVMETGAKKSVENPGAMEMLKEFKGDQGGIPFWLVLDKNGKVLADSNLKLGQNTGCPATKEEVDYFITVLQKTSSLSSEQLLTIRKRFSKINGIPVN